MSVLREGRARRMRACGDRRVPAHAATPGNGRSRTAWEVVSRLYAALMRRPDEQVDLLRCPTPGPLTQVHRYAWS